MVHVVNTMSSHNLFLRGSYHVVKYKVVTKCQCCAFDIIGLFGLGNDFFFVATLQVCFDISASILGYLTKLDNVGICEHLQAVVLAMALPKL